MMADTSKLPISRVDELIDKLNETVNLMIGATSEKI